MLADLQTVKQPNLIPHHIIIIIITTGSSIHKAPSQVQVTSGLGLLHQPHNRGSPPFFSHGFVIRNHVDIISCVCMVIFLGLIPKVKLPYLYCGISTRCCNHMPMSNPETDVLCVLHTLANALLIII